MSQKQLIVKDCDRCAKQKVAEETVRFSYDGNDYEIDVCKQHADMLDRDMRGWTRLAREIDKPISAFSLSHAERTFLRRPGTGQPPARPQQVAEPDVDLTDKSVEVDIWPTEAAIAAMQSLDVEWPKVVDAVRHPIAVTSSPDRDDVQVYLARNLKVLVAENNHVIGVAPRDPGEALPNQKTGPQKAIVRKGKRGGIGNIGPREHGDLIDAIRKADGWTMELGGKHYKITGPEGQTCTIPATPSDHRATLNAVAQLRSLGLDLREQHRSRQSA